MSENVSSSFESQKVVLHVDSLSSDGISQAKAVLNGKNVLVDFIGGMPGEEFEGRLIYQSRRSKGGCKKAKFRAVETVCVKPSPERATPRCSHFGMCGGCIFQEIPYQDQLRRKQKKIEDLFKLLSSDFVLRPILASPDEYYYRNKMEFSFSQDKSGKKFLGLIEGGSNGRVFSLRECYLSDPRVEELVKATRAWWAASDLTAYSGRSNQGTLRTLTTRVSKTTKEIMVILTVSGVPEYAPKKEHLETFCKAVETVVGENIHIILRIHQAIKGKPTQFYEMTLRGKDHIVENIAVPQFLLPDTVNEKIVAAHISPKAFFQPNTKQALRLYEVALQMASLEPHMVFWDLYCGIGLFGILAAHKVSKVIAIELDPDAAYDAKVNAERFGLENFTIFQGDVGEALQNIGSGQEVLRCDVALVDPPRAGLGIKAIQQILELQPSCLVYVSCNPATQVSDVELLIQGGYRIEEVAPIDQFPHTPHVENIVRLRRISPSI